MKITIVGAGSLGMLLAYRLKASGLNPLLITHHEEQKKHIARNGLLLGNTSDGAVYLPCVSIDEWAAGKENAQWIVCTVKQGHLEQLLQTAAPLIGDSASNWLFFQNGLGHLEKAAAFIQQKHIFAAVTTEGAKKQGPCEVLHTGTGETWLGQSLPDNFEHTTAFELKALQNLRNVLNEAGFRTEVSKNIKQRIWEKLLVNAVINPLTGIAGVPNGQLLREKRFMKLMTKLFSEGQAVAAAEHIVLSENLWQHLLQVCEKTAANRSSMLQDLDHERTTEIAWINGSIINKAAQHGIPVPTHEAVYHLIQCLH